MRNTFVSHCCVCHGGALLGSDAPCRDNCDGFYCVKHAVESDPGLYGDVTAHRQPKGSPKLKGRQRRQMLDEDEESEEATV